MKVEEDKEGKKKRKNEREQKGKETKRERERERESIIVSVPTVFKCVSLMHTLYEPIVIQNLL